MFQLEESDGRGDVERITMAHYVHEAEQIHSASEWKEALLKKQIGRTK